jgi:hypothetical protein
MVPFSAEPVFAHGNGIELSSMFVFWGLPTLALASLLASVLTLVFGPKSKTKNASVLLLAMAAIMFGAAYSFFWWLRS